MVAVSTLDLTVDTKAVLVTFAVATLWPPPLRLIAMGASAIQMSLPRLPNEDTCAQPRLFKKMERPAFGAPK